MAGPLYEIDAVDVHAECGEQITLGAGPDFQPLTLTVRAIVADRIFAGRWIVYGRDSFTGRPCTVDARSRD